MEKCQCIIPEETSWAGPALQLCHHSPPERAAEIQEKLLELMQNFIHQIPAEMLITTPMNILLEEYAMNLMTKNDYQLLKEQEHGAIRVAFLRQMGIAIQLLLTSIIVDLNEE